MAWWIALAVVACWVAVYACWRIREGIYRDRELAAIIRMGHVRGSGSEPETVDAARKIR